MRNVWHWLAAALSGLLLALAFPPFDQGWLCWVALVPLICAVWFAPPRATGGLRRAFLLGGLTGLVFFWVSLFWITEVTALGWFVFAFYLALYPAVWAVFLATVGRPRPGRDGRAWLSPWANLRAAVAASAAWVGLEWLRGTVFTGFGWNGLGVALHDATAIIQIADITGVGGISFLVGMANLIAVITVRRLMVEVGRGRIQPHYDFTITVALIALAFTYGVHHYYAEPGERVPVKVAAIQANIPQDRKWDPAFEKFILDTYRRQTEIAASLGPNLLIWPEAATPRPLLNHEDMQAAAVEALQMFSGDFLLGTTHYDYAGAFNSAVLLGPDGGVQLYNKIHLVPFGEYVPFRHTFPLFAWIVGDQVAGDFDAGTEPAVFMLKSWPIKIAPLICFEDTLGDLTRQFARRGAELLVTLTNDGWFRESAGSRQHQINSIFRAVETKLPLVRAANTGVTCFVDRLGRVTHVLSDPDGNTFIEGFLFDEIQVPVEPPETFYTRYGELFSMLCFFGSLLAIRTYLVLFRRAERIPLNTQPPDPSHSSQ